MTSRIVLHRSSRRSRDAVRSYRVFVDNARVGKIDRGQRLTVQVPPGTHIVELRIDWMRSPKLSVSVGSDEAIDLQCGSNGTKLSNFRDLLGPRDQYVYLRGPDESEEASALKHPLWSAELEARTVRRSTLVAVIKGIFLAIDTARSGTMETVPHRKNARWRVRITGNGSDAFVSPWISSYPEARHELDQLNEKLSLEGVIPARDGLRQLTENVLVAQQSHTRPRRRH